MSYTKTMKKLKVYKSPDYNYVFNLENGFFARWGKDAKDDPQFAPFPEILDLEVSTICNGLGKPCSHCYKSNTSKGQNMSFDKFKVIFDKMSKYLTQVAFGIGDIGANKDLFKMFEYCRKNDVIPNVTINGYDLSGDRAEKLAKLCGAVAVSRYNPKDYCYWAVQQLTDLGMKQVNIHCLLSEETYDMCFETLNDIKTDPRLKKLNAIVFLSLKPKGKRNNYHILKSKEKFKRLVTYAMVRGINIGFDSCSAPKFLQAMKDNKNYKKFELFTEPCESTLFSSYINVDGDFFPCSFSENEQSWKKGLSVVDCKDFKSDIWNNPKTIEFRNNLIKNLDGNKCRNCPIFKV